MLVNISNIVKNLGKDVKFMQPVYESITNSLEAGADKIEDNFNVEDIMFDIQPKITGFTIKDNGEGFNEKNRNAFLELWTTNKLSLGCKGSGRFLGLEYMKIYL